MTALDYILDGLEAELALERELGVRVVEMDRRLLDVAPPLPAATEQGAGQRETAPLVAGAGPTTPPQAAAPAPPLPTVARREGTPVSPPRAPVAGDGTSALAVAFLHHRPLSPAGEEMMAKIIAALKLTDAQAKVVVAEPLLPAKVYVVLGGLALRKWFPGLNGAPGMWIRTEDGRDVLITNSPEYILRFRTVTPALQKCKKDMWLAIKSVLRRI